MSETQTVTPKVLTKRGLEPLRKPSGINSADLMEQIPDNVIRTSATKSQKISKDVEIQTDFRESDTQTDPYTPNFVLKSEKDEFPEVIYLAEMGLSYGRGLPVGPDEIEIIERARERRAFEASLPPLTDETSFEERRKMLEEMEMKDWAFREKQIRKAQAQKLKIVEDTIRAKDQERELQNSRKIESILNRNVAARDSVVEKIREERVAVLRKLAKERENVEKKRHKRDIVEDYANFGSRVYAPLTREGRKVETLILQDIKPPALDSSDGIDVVEKRIETSTSADKLSSRANTSLSFKQDMLTSKHLDTLHESIKSSKTKTPQKLPKPAVAEKIEKPPPRPPTPTIDVPSQEEEEEEQAIIFLQKLLRGRAIQNLMYEGKERRAELIKELKASDSFVDLDEEPREVVIESKENTETDSEEIFMSLRLDEMLGAFVGKTFDFLSKELVRVHQERKIASMVEEAEKMRRMREAEESGRRQAERIAQETEDAQFLQVMEIHQKTAETYIEQIIEQSKKLLMEHNAITTAKKKSEEEKEQISRSLQLPPENIVNELLFTLAFDMVEKEINKQREFNENKKYMKAAQDALLNVVPNILQKL